MCALMGLEIGDGDEVGDECVRSVIARKVNEASLETQAEVAEIVDDADDVDICTDRHVTGCEILKVRKDFIADNHGAIVRNQIAEGGRLPDKRGSLSHGETGKTSRTSPSHHHFKVIHDFSRSSNSRQVVTMHSTIVSTTEPPTH